VAGDLDGFLGLGLDNLIQILLILGLCRGVLGYPDTLLLGTILPATGISLLVGNGAYAVQAYRLARLEGRSDRTALPYGINTVSLFAYVFLVMLPVKLAALAAGLDEAAAVQLSWQAGLVACLGSGLIEASGAFCAQLLRRWLPRAALLSTLAGIALGYIALGFLLRTYAQPVVGLTVLAVILATYYGRLQLPIPGGLLAVLVGMALAWGTGLIKLDPQTWSNQVAQVGLQLPHLELGALWQARGQLMPWLGVIVPMGLFNLLGSLQNIESAEAAGDRYPVRSSMLINGIGTIAAAALGSCFPTTIYIGHPGWKAMGARIGYSWLNGVVMAIACLLGLFGVVSQLVPIEAGMAIVLYIGLVIAAQAFQATPSAHAPAVALGQAIGRWGNFFNSEAFGLPTNLPWALTIPMANRPSEFLDQASFHPTFLYESLWNLGVCALLLVLFRLGSQGRLRLPAGALSCVYLMAYSTGRFWIEGLRLDPLCLFSQPPFCSGGLRMAQLMSLLLILLGGAGLLWLYRWRRPLPDPSGVTA